MQFPRLVYLSASSHALVHSEQEHADAIKGGWFDTVPEALAKKSDKAPAPVVKAVSVPVTEDLGTPPVAAAVVEPVAAPKKPSKAALAAAEKAKTQANGAAPAGAAKAPWEVS